MTAVAIAMPFVMAFVELPMASRPPRICAGRPSNSPDISAMPCALSLIGPNVSIDTMTPTVVSIPMPVSAMKYRRSARRFVECGSARKNAALMAPPITRIDHTVDSRPIENPDRIVVAGPVTVDSAISWTGRNFVSVKYCVRTWITLARTSPMMTASAGLIEFMYTREITMTAAAEMAADRKKPRLIAFMPCSSSERGVTARMPMIDVTTPTARTNSGNITPAIAPISRAGERGDAQDQRGDERDLVGLEQVGGHAGAVADVVAHVVGDRGGVAGVVLGDALLDLAHEVGAHVGGLREDAAADPHEHREQRAAEPEADQHAGGVLLVDDQDRGGAEQPEAHREHAGDAAGAERDAHRLAQPETRARRWPCGRSRGRPATSR